MSRRVLSFSRKAECQDFILVPHLPLPQTRNMTAELIISQKLVANGSHIWPWVCTAAARRLGSHCLPLPGQSFTSLHVKHIQRCLHGIMAKYIEKDSSAIRPIQHGTVPYTVSLQQKRSPRCINAEALWLRTVDPV